jgi:DNA-binding response OmpR family regulator
MPPYLLIVDDDPDVIGTLSRVLTREGYEIGRASSGEDAWRSINSRRPDLAVLDIMMPPGMDGLQLCRKLRADDRFVDLLVLFLTAHGSVSDVVAGLDAGGDDYVPKPFELAELTARVRALLRRTQRDAVPNKLELSGIALNSLTYEVTANGQTVHLTVTEHRLLRFLMDHVNQAVSPQRLLEGVWDYPPHSGDADLVRAHVRNLRVKLEKISDVSDFIRTVHGVGYMVVG